MVNRKDME